MGRRILATAVVLTALASPVAAYPDLFASRVVGAVVVDEVAAAKPIVELATEENPFAGTQVLWLIGRGMWNPGNANESGTLVVEDPTIDVVAGTEHGGWTFALTVNNALEWPEALTATATASHRY